MTNPTSRPIQIEVQVGSEDRHWDLGAAHRHLELKPAESRTLRLALERRGPFDDFKIPRLSLATTLVADGFELPLALRSFQLPLDPTGLAHEFDDARPNGVLVLDGEDDCIVVPHAELPLPDGPFTLEFWVRAERFAERQGLVAKTESAEFGFFASRGIPEFLVRLDGTYRAVRGPALEPERWYHLAGVFDGAELRLYVDGELQDRTPASGRRVTRNVPLLVGADVRASGDGMSFLAGRLDDVHLARGALYTGERFVPERHRAAERGTVLLLPMHAPTGPWMISAGPTPRVLELRGGPTVAR
ncbi:MAG: LamG domain-containing protein [Planctomycetota bacterium]